MASSSSSSKMNLLLIIDTKQRKVLSAETSMEVIQYLFQMFGATERARINDGSCIANVYQSMDNLALNTNTPYMITDDLVIQPVPSNYLHQDLGNIKTKVVELGQSQGERIFKASLYTTNALTEVFFREIEEVAKQSNKGLKRLFSCFKN